MAGLRQRNPGGLTPPKSLQEFQARAHEAVVPDPVARRRTQGGLVVIGIFLTIFTLLFALVRTNRSAKRDVAITLGLQRRRAPWFDRAMRLISWPGFPPQSRIIPPTLSALMLLAGFPLEALFQLLAWGTGGISFTFKRIMRRPRPSQDHHPEIRVAIARIGGTSFPSGHVLNYLGVYGFLTVLIHTHVRRGGPRRVLVAGLSTMLALVGPSRVYLGHHWATDVTASYLLGTSYLIGLTAVYRRVKSWLGRW